MRKKSLFPKARDFGLFWLTLHKFIKKKYYKVSKKLNSFSTFEKLLRIIKSAALMVCTVYHFVDLVMLIQNKPSII